MEARIDDRDLLLAPEGDRAKLETVARLLAERAESLPVVLGSHGESIELPGVVVRLLRETVELLARGRAIAFTSYPEELLPGEAAALLNIAQTEQLRLFEEGRLHVVVDDAGYRRVRRDDVLAFREQRLDQRRERLVKLIRMSEELGLYEDDGSIPGRHDDLPTG